MTMLSLCALLIIACLILSLAFFSAVEIAFFSLPAARLRSFAKSSEQRKNQIATLLSRPQNLLVTIFMMSTVCNVLIQNFISHCFSSPENWILKVGVPFILTLLFGDLIPKYLGLQNNREIAEKAAPTIEFIQNSCKSVQSWITDLTSFFSRTLFFFLKQEKLFSDEELTHILKSSEKSGILAKEEVLLVKNYYNFHRIPAWEIMKAKEQMPFFDISCDSLSKLQHLFSTDRQPQLVICNKGIDHIIGFLTAKTYLSHRNAIETVEHLLKLQLINKPFYVPESTTVAQLLRHFEQQRQTAVLVIDEYGTIKGLVEQQYILRCFIRQEIELEEQKGLYSRPSYNVIIAHATLELAELKQIFGVEIKSNYKMVTIGGWLEEQLGCIPQTGTTFQWKGLIFQVLSADPNRVRQIHIRNTGIMPKVQHKPRKGSK